MVRKLMSPTIVIALFALCNVAAGATAVPNTIGDFVVFCADHFSDCEREVRTSDVAALAEALFAKPSQLACVVPKGMDHDAAVKDILVWLSEHKNVAAMKTDDGIRAAEKHLWRCRQRIGDGGTPGGPPAKAGAFVNYCAVNYAPCANEMVSVTVTVRAVDPPQHCPPPRAIKTKELSDAVLNWLRQHPETYSLSSDDAIMIAFDHIWPCH